MDRKAYIRLKKDLRANAGHYSDEEVVALVTKLISYALTNITEKETVSQGYDYQYEGEICDIGLSLDAFFQKNTQAKSSHRLRELILQVIDNEAYRNGRDSFIYLLYRLKWMMN